MYQKSQDSEPTTLNDDDDMQPNSACSRLGGNTKWLQPLWKAVWQFLTKLNVLRHSGSPIAWYLPKGGENLYPHINPCMDVYTYFFQTWKQLKMSFSR